MLPSNVAEAMERAGFEIGRKLGRAALQRVRLLRGPDPSRARPLRIQFTGVVGWALELGR